MKRRRLCVERCKTNMVFSTCIAFERALVGPTAEGISISICMARLGSSEQHTARGNTDDATEIERIFKMIWECFCR